MYQPAVIKLLKKFKLFYSKPTASIDGIAHFVTWICTFFCGLAYDFYFDTYGLEHDYY